MRKRKTSGIQKKYLMHTLALLILALLLSSIGVWVYVRKNMTSVIVDKYEFMNEKMGISLDNLYKKTDDVTAECITDDSVQKSLRTKGLENVEKSALSKYFAYIDLEHVAEYCYVDNKENVYTKSYSNISYEDFKESGFQEIMPGQNGFLPGTHCLAPGRKRCSLGDMCAAWIMPMRRECCFSR